jgi:hypothetical protein
MKRIVAFDPGGTTGWAYADIRQSTTIEHNRADPVSNDWIVTFTQGMIGPHRHHLELYNFLELIATDDFTIVCESFEYRNDSRPGLVLDSKEYIGVIELFHQQRSIPRAIKYQTASMGKIRSKGHEAGALVKMSNLKQLGLWSLGDHGERHMIDATGHLLSYMLNEKNAIPTPLRMDLLRRGWK